MRSVALPRQCGHTYNNKYNTGPAFGEKSSFSLYILSMRCLPVNFGSKGFASKLLIGGIEDSAAADTEHRLLNAKSVTPRDNQERPWGLVSATMLVPLILDVLSLILR
jgi:hypothetical protein